MTDPYWAHPEKCKNGISTQQLCCGECYHPMSVLELPTETQAGVVTCDREACNQQGERFYVPAPSITWNDTPRLKVLPQPVRDLL